MSDRDRRRELGEFLRGRRERLRPRDVGLPEGERRRVVGLRREEVAGLAHVSVTWYTHLEQGRDVRPSDEVLDSLARVLRLTEDESRYMYAIARGVPQVGSPLFDRPEASLSVMVRAVDLFADSPQPVIGTDQHLDVLAANPAARDWYGDWSTPPGGTPNLLEWALFAPEARERLVSWEDETRDTVARWRSLCARVPGTERRGALIERFTAQSPEFATWWSQYDLQEHRTRRRAMRHPVHGVREFEVLPLLSPALPGGILLYMPVDPAAEDSETGA